MNLTCFLTVELYIYFISPWLFGEKLNMDCSKKCTNYVHSGTKKLHICMCEYRRTAVTQPSIRPCWCQKEALIWLTHSGVSQACTQNTPGDWRTHCITWSVHTSASQSVQEHTPPTSIIFPNLHLEIKYFKGKTRIPTQETYVCCQNDNKIKWIFQLPSKVAVWKTIMRIMRALSSTTLQSVRKIFNSNACKEKGFIGLRAYRTTQIIRPELGELCRLLCGPIALAGSADLTSHTLPQSFYCITVSGLSSSLS